MADPRALLCGLPPWRELCGLRGLAQSLVLEPRKLPLEPLALIRTPPLDGGTGPRAPLAGGKGLLAPPADKRLVALDNNPAQGVFLHHPDMP
jgi:hypothetical protein